MKIKVNVTIVLGKTVTVDVGMKDRFRKVRRHLKALVKSGDLGPVIMDALEADYDYRQRRIGFKAKR